MPLSSPPLAAAMADAPVVPIEQEPTAPVQAVKARRKLLGAVPVSALLEIVAVILIVAFILSRLG